MTCCMTASKLRLPSERLAQVRDSTDLVAAIDGKMCEEKPDVLVLALVW